MKGRIEVKIRARAKTASIKGKVGACVKIDLQSPPVDGRANQELIQFIARLTGVTASNVSIVLGKTSARKLIEVEGISQEELLARLQ